MRINKFTILILAPLWLCFTGLAYADLDDERDIGGSSTPAPTKKPPTESPATTPNLGSPSKPKPSPDSSMSIPPPKQPANAKKPKSKPDPVQNEKHDSKQPINWSAKGLKGSKDSKVLELQKEVVVTQGKVKLEADNAKVFFNEKNEVLKVLAFGRKEKNDKKEKDDSRTNVVKLTKEAELPQDRISARGNEAIFDNLKRTVTLIGRAALWRGGDVVRGKQIVYNLDSGWINVDSVEGVVQPGEENKNELKSP